MISLVVTKILSKLIRVFLACRKKKLDQLSPPYWGSVCRPMTLDFNKTKNLKRRHFFRGPWDQKVNLATWFSDKTNVKNKSSLTKIGLGEIEKL